MLRISVVGAVGAVGRVDRSMQHGQRRERGQRERNEHQQQDHPPLVGLRAKVAAMKHRLATCQAVLVVAGPIADLEPGISRRGSAEHHFAAVLPHCLLNKQCNPRARSYNLQSA
jgi:hypothetical protein